jgi:hypothetical protein
MIRSGRSESANRTRGFPEKVFPGAVDLSGAIYEILNGSICTARIGGPQMKLGNRCAIKADL